MLMIIVIRCCRRTKWFWRNITITQTPGSFIVRWSDGSGIRYNTKSHCGEVHNGFLYLIDGVVCCGDFDRSVEVLQNVMENAIKYGDGENIEITVSEDEGWSVSKTAVVLLIIGSCPIFLTAFWEVLMWGLPRGMVWDSIFAVSLCTKWKEIFLRKSHRGVCAQLLCLQSIRQTDRIVGSIGGR